MLPYAGTVLNAGLTMACKREHAFVNLVGEVGKCGQERSDKGKC
jgi:hypothetical protein